MSQLSESCDTMLWKMEHFEKLKDSFPNAKSGLLQFLGNFLLLLILYEVERRLENEIQCPCDLQSNTRYILVVFVLPALSLFIVGLLVQSYLQNWCRLGWSKQKIQYCPPPSLFILLTVFKASIPAIIWIVLLFLNGNYYACFELIGKNETACGWKCNDNPCEILQSLCIESQLIGGLALVILLTVFAVLYFLQCYSSWKKKYMFKYDCKHEKVEAKLLREKSKTEATEAAKETCKNMMLKLFPKDVQFQPAPSHENINMNSQVSQDPSTAQ
ncbi:calcium homeostasis modulator protein 6-like isoform X2 [Stegostoma tigrinum]|uniref:calcium homeostasis modulator protein 6-like isoform X2 n=1 Tax=Stegostoma tigrinum TaxID=3053191 RepID=UPI00287056DC|nr:calcium homeostasis modulator protein 6-like isoform X2 [Stegostoma tigrinum]